MAIIPPIKGPTTLKMASLGISKPKKVQFTPLCELALKYRTDKGPGFTHMYTPIYYQFLRDKRESIKKVLELGIGYQTPKNIGFGYERGAGHYMWRDFFPNAQIYGADIVPESIFQDERITTYLCDETKEEDLLALIAKTGTDIDLFVDDGSHRTEHQASTAKILKPLLKDTIYIIEDVAHLSKLKKMLPIYEYKILTDGLIQII